MKLIALILLFVSFSAQSQVFNQNNYWLDFSNQIDTIPNFPYSSAMVLRSDPTFSDSAGNIKKPIWRTTVAKEKIVSAQLLLTKEDGSIIVIDSAWKMNIRKETDKVAVIYPDSTRVVYRISDKKPPDMKITIPFEISKRTFDGATNIKLEIFR